MGRLVAAGSLVVAGGAGILGALVASPPTAQAAAASATSTTSTTQTIEATIDFVCTVALPAAGITLYTQDVPAQLDITAPSTIDAGSTFTVHTSSVVSLPEAVVATASGLGITGVQVTDVQAGVTATDVTPASTTVGAEGLPLTVPASSFGSGVAVTLQPLTYTAGSAGTATFDAGTLTVTSTVQGGEFAGDTNTISCPAPAAPKIGTLTIAPAAVVSAPTVSSVSPSSGSTAGGTQVTITGTNLSGATAVDFGSTAAQSFTAVSATQITATSPAESAGTVDVTVTTPGGTSATSSADEFTYVAPTTVPSTPVVSSLDPTSGPASGGTTVRIFGTGFGGASAVHFGSTSATSFTVVGDGEIDAVAPGGTGTVDVTVTGPDGTSASTVADRYTYTSGPEVSLLYPDSGPAGSGYQLVFILGHDLTGATSVTFGGVAAPFDPFSSIIVMAFAPPGAPGTVDVQVTTPGGTSPASVGDRYTYVGSSSGSAVTASDRR